MPGPSNARRKRKSQGKLQKNNGVKPRPSLDSQSSSSGHSDSFTSDILDTPLSRTPSRVLTSSPHDSVHLDIRGMTLNCDQSHYTSDEPLLALPFIHDPGNGPRVRDTRAFLTSKFFAQPPALDIPLCAEFAQEEVLQMLCTVLPEETALILWYNKSRSTSRICPACQRLYRMGDILPDLMSEGVVKAEKHPSPLLEQEQSISGLCSPVCFVLASFNYPGAIHSAWGRMEDEMDDKTWELLNGPGDGNVQNDVSRSLGMLVKMTRLHDLGLAQLCLGDDGDGDGDGGYDDGEDWGNEVDV